MMTFLSCLNKLVCHLKVNLSKYNKFLSRQNLKEKREYKS